MVKNLPASAGDARDLGLIPGLGICPGEWNGNPLQYYCPKNSTDRGAWQAIVHGAAKSWTQLSTSMMHYSPTGDKYLLHHFIWIKPNKRLVKNKVKIIL